MCIRVHEANDTAHNHSDKKWRNQSLRHSPCGRRPEWFGILQRLPPDQKKSTAQGDHRDPEPKQNEVKRRANSQQVTGNAPRYSDDATKSHDWRERAAVERGTFHQRADDLQMLGGLIRFHAITLQGKAGVRKRKYCLAADQSELNRPPTPARKVQSKPCQGRCASGAWRKRREPDRAGRWNQSPA